jgi:hypothetical protein
MSLNKTSELLGKPYAGSSWTVTVKKVVEHLKSTTTPPNHPVLGLESA